MHFIRFYTLFNFAEVQHLSLVLNFWMWKFYLKYTILRLMRCLVVWSHRYTVKDERITQLRNVVKWHLGLYPSLWLVRLQNMFLHETKLVIYFSEYHVVYLVNSTLLSLIMFQFNNFLFLLYAQVLLKYLFGYFGTKLVSLCEKIWIGYIKHTRTQQICKYHWPISASGPIVKMAK